MSPTLAHQPLGLFIVQLRFESAILIKLFLQFKLLFLFCCVPLWLCLLEDWKRFLFVILRATSYFLVQGLIIVDLGAECGGPMRQRILLSLYPRHLVPHPLLLLLPSCQHILIPLMNRPLVIDHNFILKLGSLEPFRNILGIKNILLVDLIPRRLNRPLLMRLLPPRWVLIKPISSLC